MDRHAQLDSAELKFIMSALQAFMGRSPDWPRDSINWRRLERLLSYHQLAPVVAQLEHDGELSLPPATSRALKTASRRSSIRNLSLIQELSRVDSTLQVEKIDYILLKGPGLATDLYGNPALRPYQDIDILVRQEDLERVEFLLKELGYAPETTLPKRDHIPYHQAFTKQNQVVEIHWRLDRHRASWGCPLENIFRDSREHSIGDLTVNLLSRSHQLKFLLDHGAYHRWRRMKWILDLILLIRKHLDVSEIETQMGMIEGERARQRLESGLLFFDILTPNDMQRLSPILSMTPSTASKLIRYQASIWNLNEISRSSVKERLEMGYFYFPGDSWWAYLNHTFLDPAPIDRQMWDLPSGANWLYVLFRPLRMGWDHAKSRLASWRGID